MDLIGESLEFKNAYTLALHAAMFEMPVLLTGETGTGKDVFAKLIHNKSDRKKHPFVAVNCATLTSDLLQSELFGYMKGSFTNAIKDYAGKFRMANEGTLFLDEIGEMEVALQTKLLRVLEDKVVWPIGSEKGYRVNVKIITATNQNLQKNILENRFREDLFYRLNVLDIELPPLRERSSDILNFVKHFTKCFLLKYDLPPKKISEKVINIFQNYSWPGNIRELKNVIEKILSIPSASRVIEPQNLPDDFLRHKSRHQPESKNIYHQFQNLKSLGVTAKDYENFLIKQELSKTNGVGRKAAKNLKNFNISRHTVRRYLASTSNNAIDSHALTNKLSLN